VELRRQSAIFVTTVYRPTRLGGGTALRYLRFLWHDSQEEEPIDQETAVKLDAAIAEGGQPVSLEEVKRRYGL
jgi:hypothetical protein